MIIIDQNKCIGCSKCTKDCFMGNIIMDEGKAKLQSDACIFCGHCVAVCPQNAFEIDHFPKDNELSEEASKEIEATDLLHFIKMRRTIRNFSDKPVEREKLEMVLEAGRYTPTASNRQSVSYIVVQEKLPEVLDMAAEKLKEIGEGLLQSESTPPILKSYAQKWINMYDELKADPEKPTFLFFKSKTVILVVSDTPVDGHLAASTMELMLHAQGLGMLFSGFFVRAVTGNKKLKDFLGIDDSKEVVSCLVVGYPEVTYKRYAPRKKADVSWL